MSKEDLFERIKKMDLDECVEYQSSAKGTNSIIHLLGIGMCFAIVSFSSIAFALCGAFVIYVLAKLSTGIDETVRKLEERICTLSPDE